MSGRVEGKVAVVTGAARGQGRAHALKLAQEGADVIALDICAPIASVDYAAATREELEETVDLVKALGRRAAARVVDTRDLDALKSAVDESVREFDRLDVVIANAGICVIRPWDQVTPEIFRDTIDVNLTGTWNTVMACAPHLISNGGGSIVLTSSAAGLKGLPFMSAYVASKHGVTGLARAFAHELARHNIRVNSLHPGSVRTPMVDGAGDLFAAALAENPGVAGILGSSLQAEATEPEDQANAALFLASDESRYVTALAMTVDCGNSQY